MPEVVGEDELRALAEDGIRRGLFSAAAIGVESPAQRTLVHAGTHGFDDPREVTDQSLFDLASLTKTIVAAVIVSLIDDGLLEPNTLVAPFVPEEIRGALEVATVGMLLTHTAGLAAMSECWREGARPGRDNLRAAYAAPLESEPGAHFEYSCLGFIALGLLAESLVGRPLVDIAAERVTGPLGMSDTTFGPVDRDCAVATEEQPYAGRALVRGEVHDELAWYLGGEVGNAGLFSTAHDVLRFASVFAGRGPGILSADGRRLMTQNSLPPTAGAAFEHGFGLRRADPGFMGNVDGVGHTGFTGTMWVTDVETGTAVVLLTNRVHPDRSRSDISGFRRELVERVLG